jgi:AbrB family looped-hinge helix DNA binding protein
MKAQGTARVQVGQRGVVVLPKEIRDSYRLQPGDSLTLLDLGGAIVLSPEHSQVDSLADRFAQELQDKGESLETMLRALREERERLAGQG